VRSDLIGLKFARRVKNLRRFYLQGL